MMRSVIVTGVAMVVLLAGNLTRAADCEFANGSFEADGWIPNLKAKAPNGWPVVDMPSGKFGGYVYTNWASRGTHSLTLYSDWAGFSDGDMATVSQDVNLVDVVRIAFDIKLDTGSAGAKWDPNICTAVLLIDGDVVWDSNSAGLVVKGEYPGEVFIEKKYRTEGLHRVSLGIRVNVNNTLWETYFTRWDGVDCNFCSGPGFLKGDIDRDCYVDAKDLKVLAGLWLSDGVDPNDAANLSHVGDDLTSYATIDFRDFANYAAAWPGDMIGMEGIAAYWLAVGVVDPDYEYNLFHGDDIRPRAAINFFDLAVLAETWLGCSGAEEGP